MEDIIWRENSLSVMQSELKNWHIKALEFCVSRMKKFWAILIMSYKRLKKN